MYTKLPLIIAILFGVIAFVGIGKYLKDRNVSPPMVNLLVATSNRQRGEVLTRADIGIRAFPQEAVRGMTGVYRPGEESLIANTTLTQDIGTGNVILVAHLRRETDVRGAEAAFTANLRPGQRAISIPLDAEGMVSNFVRPGDRVDILVNMDIPEVIEEEIQIPNAMPQVIRREVSRPTTVFLFQNVKVLAVGDEFLQPNVVTVETTRGRGARTVTIAVTPEEAQTLSFAMRYGNRTALANNGVTFTLLLRRGDDLDTLDQTRLVTFEDFKQLGELGRLQLERNVRNSQERSSGLDAILGQQQTNP